MHSPILTGLRTFQVAPMFVLQYTEILSSNGGEGGRLQRVKEQSAKFCLAFCTPWFRWSSARFHGIAMNMAEPFWTTEFATSVAPDAFRLRQTVFGKRRKKKVGDGRGLAFDCLTLRGHQVSLGAHVLGRFVLWFGTVVTQLSLQMDQIETLKAISTVQYHIYDLSAMGTIINSSLLLIFPTGWNSEILFSSHLVCLSLKSITWKVFQHILITVIGNLSLSLSLEGFGWRSKKCR